MDQVELRKEKNPKTKPNQKKKHRKIGGKNPQEMQSIFPTHVRHYSIKTESKANQIGTCGNQPHRLQSNNWNLSMATK